MKFALAQINPTVGDLRRNTRKIVDVAGDARRRGADLIIFPELCVTGYPPHDLLESDAFLDAVEDAVRWIAGSVPSDIGVLIGTPLRNPNPTGKRLFNAAVLLEGGRPVAQVKKSLLPTYEVYDEYRYFEPAAERRCVDWRGMRLGIHICEDMWNSAATDARMYAVDPLEELAADGADLFVNLSATPFSIGQRDRRHAVIEEICGRFNRHFLTANQVGANTELIFDGDSRVHRPDGRLACCAPSFEEALLIWDSAGDDASPNSRRFVAGGVADGKADSGADGVADSGADGGSGGRADGVADGVADGRLRDGTEDIFRALVVGVGDYYGKSNAFSGILIGLSGGIDSAVTATLAAEAVGADKVMGVMMASEYTPPESVEDARAVAAHLGIALQEVPINAGVEVVLDLLGESTGGAVTVVEENVQARIRAVVLMGLSNRTSRLLLATGNKSELAVGYTTLYGDLAGGLGVLSDVYKSTVIDLARYINARSASNVIPERVITKPPSAELRPGQTDQDALPAYDQLDVVLEMYIERRLDVRAICARSNYDPELVLDIVKRVDAAEFKRRQAPPGLRISRRAFGTAYRMPLVAGWTHDPALTAADPSHDVESSR